MSFNIIGTGMYVPENIVTNDDLGKIVETSDEWISKRVGIRRRRLSVDETAADMATKAALSAIADSGIDKSEIDLIITASVSGETVSPSTACMVQKNLGLSCTAFEINAACSAFIFLLETAAAYFSLGRYKHILIVGAERMSRITDWSDRSTCVIFGDGAGAALLEKGDGYIDSVFSVHGNDTIIKIPNYIGKSPYYKVEPESPYIHMNGQETFKFAVNSMCADVASLIERNHLTNDDISLIVPHQANKRIIDFAAEKLHMPKEKFFVNIEEYGNTSSASIPIALCEAKSKGLIQKGSYIILTAFGGGLASAACLIKW